MADSRNQPELETLSYKPECVHKAIVKQYGPIAKKRIKPGMLTMGFNSVVIKPEIRVNKAEDAGKHLQESLCRESAEQLKCKTCGDSKLKWIGHGHRRHRISCPDCQTEQPNQNLMIIEEVEGLMSQVNEKLDKLREDNFLSAIRPESLSKQREIKHFISQALEDIDLFQKTTLFDLRKAFE